MPGMSSATVLQVGRALARFATEDVPAAPPAERAAWADALLDGEDPGAATDQLVVALRDGKPASAALPAAARRLPAEYARSVVAAAIDDGHVNAKSYDTFGSAPVAGGFAHLAVGSDETEEALLRAVLVVRQSEDRPSGAPYRNRVRRIAAVLAVLSDAHRGEPERLAHWARILGDADRPRLAGAASLLAPLGLAEIDRRCGEFDDDDAALVEAVPLVRALAEAGRRDEALELATRLQPHARQEALVAMALVVTDQRDAWAVVAAFRACPKGDRSRDQQMMHRHRLARVLLAFGRVDDALAELAKMRDCRYTGFGPAQLAWEIVRWFDQRPGEATGQRLRVVLDVLESPDVIPQELAAHVAKVLHRVFLLAGPALRTEVIDTRASGLRARLQPGDWALVDAGLAAGLIAAGRVDEAMAFLRGATRTARHGRRLFFMVRPLIAAAVDAGLADRDPDLFAEVFALAATGSPASPALAVRLGPAGRATAARMLDRLPGELAGQWARWLADAAATTGDLDALLILLESAADQASALTIGRRIAMALVRRGEPADARAVAEACGLRHNVPAGATPQAG